MAEAETPTTPETPAAPPEETIEQAAERVFGPATPKPADKETAEPSTPALPADSEADKPKDEPKAEKVSKRLVAAEKALLKVTREREALAAQRAEVQPLAEAFQAARSAGLEVSDVRELVKLAAQVKQAKGSPTALIEMSGMSPKDFLLALEGEHSPENVAKRAARDVAREATSEVKQLREQIAQLQAQKIGEQVEANVSQVKQAFIKHVAAKADTYPHLISEFAPDEMAERGIAALNEVVGHDERGKPVTRSQAFTAKEGREPTDDEIAEFLEYQAAERARSRASWDELTGKRPKPSEGGESVGRKAPQDSRGTPSPRTLSSRATSERASSRKAMTQEELDEESLRILASAIR